MLPDLLNDSDVRARVTRVESLLETLERWEDERLREIALEAVRGVLELHGEALGRVIAAVAKDCGTESVVRLAQDELVGQVLLLHDLHPLSVEERVRRALDAIRPYLVSHGCRVELLSVENSVARLKLEAGGCASTAASLRQSIEEAVRQAAPELEEVVADGTAQNGGGSAPALVQLTVAGRSASGVV